MKMTKKALIHLRGTFNETPQFHSSSGTEMVISKKNKAYLLQKFKKRKLQELSLFEDVRIQNTGFKIYIPHEIH